MPTGQKNFIVYYILALEPTSLLNHLKAHFAPQWCFIFLVTPEIPDIVNLPLNKPSQAMTNSYGDQRWVVGPEKGWLVGCQACLFICEVARVTGIVHQEWVQCFQSEGRGITGNMTWHSPWTRPLSHPLHHPLHRLHLQRHSLPLSSHTTLPAAWVTLSSQSNEETLTSDLWAYERRGLLGGAKLALGGWVALRDGRLALVTVQTLSAWVLWCCISLPSKLNLSAIVLILYWSYCNGEICISYGI